MSAAPVPPAAAPPPAAPPAAAPPAAPGTLPAAPGTLPAEDKKAVTPITISGLATGLAATFGGLLIFMIVFHAGAAYLSYQKYQSGLWALLDFFFAGFYYPYYAFFLSGSSVEASPINTMLGGLRKVLGKKRR